MSRWRWRRLAGALLALAVLGVGIALLHEPALRRIGAALIVEDLLAKSDAVVVLAGGTPFREAAAAVVFREGWAPRVIISRAATPKQHRELLRLGVRSHDWQEEARLSLERYGVPPAAIIALPDLTQITEGELALVHRFARDHGYGRVILISEAAHARRVKLIWSRLPGGGVEGLLHPVRDERFDPDRWWQWRRMAESVLHEYLGILAIYLGVSHLMS
jgi:uncharacterized SAM-binding protein YcdF (DUF218 family)